MSRGRQFAIACGASALSFLVGAAVYQNVFGCGLSRSTAALVQLGQIREALWVFQAEHGRFPTEQEGLDALQPLLMRPVSRDPWGKPYAYVLVHAPEPIALSYGADGKPGGSGADADLSTEWFTKKR